MNENNLRYIFQDTAEAIKYKSNDYNTMTPNDFYYRIMNINTDLVPPNSSTIYCKATSDTIPKYSFVELEKRADSNNYKTVAISTSDINNKAAYSMIIKVNNNKVIFHYAYSNISYLDIYTRDTENNTFIKQNRSSFNNVDDYVFTARAQQYIGANSWSLFPSIQNKADGGTITSLTFNGSGSVDNIEFTQGNDPNPILIPAALEPVVASEADRTYTGEELTGVDYPDDAYGYELTDNMATEVGSYTATATPYPGFAWTGNSPWVRSWHFRAS